MPITGGEITAGGRALLALRRALKRPDPERVVDHRNRVKAELRQNLKFSGDDSPEVLIFRLGQNSYPDWRYRILRPDDWIKVEVKGLHDRGLEVFTGIYEVEVRKGKARLNNGGRKVFGVGRVPYEMIARMDWSCDNADQLPVLHVSYGRRGPCREFALFERVSYGFSEMPRIKLKVRRKGWLYQVRSNRKLRRHERKAHRNYDQRRYGGE